MTEQKTYTVAECGEHIGRLVDRIITCGCTCNDDLIDLAIWRNRRDQLTDRGVPTPREAP